MRTPLVIRPLPLVLLALALSSWSAPRPAVAQCLDPSVCGESGSVPAVTIEPAEGSWSGAAATLQLVVTVSWCDGQTVLAPATRTLTLDGATVTGAFDYVEGTAPGCASAAISTGTVTLTPGTHTLTAKIRNSGGQWGQAAATYTYTQTSSPPGGGANVSVTPDARAAVRGVTVAGAERFVVANTGTAAATFLLSAACTGTSGACAPTQARVTLGAGATAAVAVTYTTPAVRATATVMLTASAEGAAAVRDSGSYAVTAAPGASQGQPGDVGVTVNVNRGDCVMLPAALAGVYECGDLRLALPLPGVRVLNRGFAPTLLYNSQHARPFPVVGANVTPRAGTSPTAVVATLTLASGGTHAKRFAGWGAETRRVAVGFDATGLPSSFYGYTFTVDAEYAGAPTERIYSGSGTLAVVNRAASPFGAGWWLAGLEGIQPAGDGTLRWIGGDGSTQRYLAVPGSANRWYAEPYDGADTIVYNPADQHYRRVLPGGDTVVYNHAGVHVATVNRHGHRTRFEYRGSDLVLHLPTAAGGFGTGQAYTFVGGAPGGKLTRVEAPGIGGARVVHVTMDGQRRVTGFDGPDTTYVRLGYLDALPRVGWWEDRRHVRSSFSYDAASRLDLAVAPGAVEQYDPQESWGVAMPVPLGWLYTGYNGPRDDVPDYTFFYVNRHGAPTGMVNAEYRLTEIFRQDPRWPGRVTKVRHPNGRELTATYDDAGRLVASTDWATRSADGRHATTLYEWDERCGEVARVTLPEGEQTTRKYDALCRLEWVQPGSDPARRTHIGYFPSTHPSAPGLVASVTHPRTAGQTSAPVERYEYDGRGNLSAVVTPLGFRTATFADALGRDTLVVPPAGAQTRSVYDGMDRVVRTTTFSGADSLMVTQQYDQAGNLRFVARQMVPDTNRIGRMTTEWRYDAAGRRRAEVAPDGQVDSTVYNPAGLAVEVHTRRGHVIRMAYDLLGRLVRREVPAVAEAPEQTTWGGRTWSYPVYPLDPTLAAAGQRSTIPGDTAVFTYDEMGNLRTATNRDAWVRRSYDAAGRLTGDTLRIRTYLGRDSTLHAYGIAYGHDLNGRPAWLRHPGVLAQGSATPDTLERYGYDRETGGLATVRDLTGNLFRYAYNAAGQLDTLYKPNGQVVRHRYDPDGRLLRRLGGNAMESDTLAYDPLGKITFARSGVSTTAAWYTPFGPLRRSESVLPHDRSTLAVDPLGNVKLDDRWHLNTSVEPPTTRVIEERAYYPGTGRLFATQTYDPTYNRWSGESGYSYDRAGNRFKHDVSTVIVPDDGTRAEFIKERTRFYYGADDRLRVVDRQRCWVLRTLTQPATCVGWQSHSSQDPGVFEEYRYDALGRRILKRSRSPVEQCPMASWSCEDVVERTVWAGDQILWEIRNSGGVGAIEEDFGSGYTSGRVGYTHGPGIDMPLSFVRLGYAGSASPPAVIVHLNWRGLPDWGTFPNGDTVSAGLRISEIDWPAKNYNAMYREVDPYEPTRWFGSLITGQRDASGQFYRRNRFYDPQAGQFTQEDPIGFAGGLNLYGFGGGDPVSYSDPYGLSADNCCTFREETGIAPPTLEELKEIGAKVLRLLVGECGREIKCNMFPISPGVGALARGAANAAQATGHRGAVAAFESAEGRAFTATSGQRPTHPRVQQMLDDLPLAERSPFHGKCAEINCLSDVHWAGVDPQGGTMSVLRVRGPGNPNHATPIPPCSSCGPVVRQAGVRIVP